MHRVHKCPYAHKNVARNFSRLLAGKFPRQTLLQFDCERCVTLSVVKACLQSRHFYRLHLAQLKTNKNSNKFFVAVSTDLRLHFCKESCLLINILESSFQLRNKPKNKQELFEILCFAIFDKRKRGNIL